MVRGERGRGGDGINHLPVPQVHVLVVLVSNRHKVLHVRRESLQEKDMYTCVCMCMLNDSLCR